MVILGGVYKGKGLFVIIIIKTLVVLTLNQVQSDGGLGVTVALKITATKLPWALNQVQGDGIR